MVISQINAVKCRGYRGTKSITGKNPTNQKSVVVKAQRVDGSYIGNLYLNKNTNVKMYSTGFLKLASRTQNPFLGKIKRIKIIHDLYTF